MDSKKNEKETIEHLWTKVVEDLRREIPESSFETWIAPVKVSSNSPGTLNLKVPNKFYQVWLSENYEEIIKNKATEVWGRPMELTYIVEEPAPEPETQEEAQKEAPHPRVQLNPKYTFDTFVVGSGNQFAHAACAAVAEEPGKTYNPLFIYGGVGLGKTHLLHAIGHRILSRQPKTKVVYISAEKFMNELIDGIRLDRMANFRKKYRGADVLLVDDIQFLAGKDRTQEEFFHTFNELHEANRQIVISSDRYPGEMERLEERLRSRFQWGLIADIQPPDLETRMAILEKKAEMEGINLSQEIIYFIAKRVKSNVRELEGCLIRLGAISSIVGRPITLDMAKRALRDLFPQASEEVTVERIQKLVCDHFQVRLSELKSKKRSRSVVVPRQIAMYLARKYTHHSLPDLGEAFGGKDHTSVLHSIRKVEKMLKEDEEMRRTVEKLEKLLED